MSDRELLEQLARHRSEDAFNEILRRHLDLVHSAALRQLGNPDAARDITQNVFLLLVRRASRIPRDSILTGWLYRTTRNLCLESIRHDERRRRREQTAVLDFMNRDTANDWDRVAPELEPAMDELADADRQAVLLRFFENKSLREVGAELGIGEDAAQKRVARAVERLRDIFTQRGVTLSGAALTAAISGGAVQAAPVALLSGVATGVVATGLATTALNTTTTMSTLLNLKTAAAIVGAAAITGTSTYLVKENETDRLRDDLQTVTQQFTALSDEQQNAMGMIRLRDEQIEQLKQDAADIHRLRGEVDRLNRELGEQQEAYARLSTSHRNAYAELEAKKQLIADLVAGKAEAELEAEQFVAFEQMKREHMEALKMWKLQLRIDAKDAERERGGTFRLVGGKNTEELFQNSKYARSETFSFDNYEQVHFGDVSNGNAIVIRQKQPFVSPDGKRIKLYAFVDGSVQTVAEGFGGYQTFEDFEREHIIPLDQQSPSPR